MPKPKNMPDAAWAIYEAALMRIRRDNPGISEEDAAKRAWGAVKNAGWHKQGDTWVKTKEMSLDVAAMIAALETLADSPGEDVATQLRAVIAQFADAPRKEGLPAKCWAYVPDSQKPTTWKLRYRNADGSVDMNHLAKAAAAFSPGGFRGNKVQIPAEDVAGVKAKLRSAYREAGKKKEEIPKQLFSQGGDTTMGQIKALPSFMEGKWQGKGMTKPEEFPAEFVDELAYWTLEWMDSTGQTPKVFIGSHDESLQDKLAGELGLSDVTCLGQVAGLFTSFKKTDDGRKKVLYSDLENVPQEVIALVEGKQLPDVSIAMGEWDGHTIMTHLCLVGIEQPAVQGLAKVGTFSDVKPDYLVAMSEITSGATKPGLFQRTKGKVNRMLQRSNQRNQSPDFAQFTDALEALRGELEQLVDKKIGGFVQNQQVRDAAERAKGVREFCDGLFGKKDGLVLAPALRPHIEALLLDQPDKNGQIQFTMPDGKEKVSGTREELLQKLLAGLQFVRLGDGQAFTMIEPEPKAPDYTKIGRGAVERQLGFTKNDAGDIATVVAATLAAIEAQKKAQAG